MKFKSGRATRGSCLSCEKSTRKPPCVQPALLVVLVDNPSGARAGIGKPARLLRKTGEVLQPGQPRGKGRNLQAWHERDLAGAIGFTAAGAETAGGGAGAATRERGGATGGAGGGEKQRGVDYASIARFDDYAAELLAAQALRPSRGHMELVMKLDVEGAECRAFEGMRGFLGRDDVKVRFVMMEWAWVRDGSGGEV